MAEKEDWEKELLVPAPGRLVYMGQGQMHYVHFHKGTPDPLWPKKKKKKANTPQPSPVPELRPVEDAEIAASQLKEDWDAEIAASQEISNGPFKGHPISYEKTLSIDKLIY
jgi:hypothetical protein